MFNIKEIRGVIPALITVFDEQEGIDEKGTREIVNYLLGQGVAGFYLTGSTGEGFLMTPEERKQYVEIVVDEVGGRVPIIVHVGAIGTKISVELAKHAYEQGADAVSSVPPFYWRFSEDSIYQYYKDIAEATPLPMIVYNIPLAGVLGMDMVNRLSKIENVKGIKYTATTHYEMSQIKRNLGDDFMVYSGCDEMALSGLLNGADGLIGSFYNLMPEVFIKIQKSLESGEIETANRYQQYAIEIIALSLKYSFPSLMKAALKWMGLNGGYCRRPFINLDEKDMPIIKEAFINLKKEHNIEGVAFMDVL